jgi:peptidoglycan/xylan/chitin deacetylase (PgdA/CDA1 family)
MMSVGLHPRLIGQASRIHALREFLEYVEAKGGAWITGRVDIARWWHEQSLLVPSLRRG